MFDSEVLRVLEHPWHSSQFSTELSDKFIIKLIIDDWKHR